MKVRTMILAILALVTASLVGSPAADAAGDPYAADPLGLVPFIDTAQQIYSTGTDTWEVWVCEVGNGDLGLDPGQVTATLATEITPYFEWLSGGQYSPEFVTGGIVESDDVIDEEEFEQEMAFATGCGDAVATASKVCSTSGSTTNMSKWWSARWGAGPTR